MQAPLYANLKLSRSNRELEESHLPLRMMCLTAHPDDEAGAFGGALLLAAGRSVDTAVLCLTEGNAGSYREPGQSDEELGGLRRAEFAESCRALGVRDAELLQYRDGALWQEPFLPLVGVLVGALRRFRPHVVLTFGGEGGVNLHRDHTAVSLAGTAAFHWAGRAASFPEQIDNLQPWAPQKLYYAATPYLSSTDEALKRSGTRTPVSLLYRLSSDIQAQKFAAFAKHTSQKGLLDRVQKEFRDVFVEEGYLLAAAREPSLAERDLWDARGPSALRRRAQARRGRRSGGYARCRPRAPQASGHRGSRAISGR